MEQVRPSILNRRPRSAVSASTWESADEQYRREQELLAAKARRLREAEQRLINSLYPSAEHIRARQQEVQQLQEQQLAAQAEARHREAEQEAKYSIRARAGSLDNIRSSCPMVPWSACVMSYTTEEAAKERRRQFAAEAAAENLALMAARAKQRQQQQLEEAEAEKAEITSESQYWNLGAASRRWISPEYRHLAPGSTRSSSAGGGAGAAAVAPPWGLDMPLERTNSGRPVTAPVVSDHDLPRSQRRHYQRPQSSSTFRNPWEWSGMRE